MTRLHWVPAFSMLPTDIQEGFRKTFNYTSLTAVKNIKKRTTAEEWNRALLSLAIKEPNPNLATCSKNKKHIYPAHNTTCPWCGATTIHDSGFMKAIRGFWGY